MLNYDKRVLYPLLAIAVVALCIIAAKMAGCGNRPPSAVSAPDSDLVGTPTLDCPPNAAYCPAPLQTPIAPGPGSRVVGRLSKPVRASVLIRKPDGSDPRVIDRDIPAGVWLVADAEMKGL